MNRTSRRTLLAAVGGAVVAGCLDEPPTNADGSSGNGDPNETDANGDLDSNGDDGDGTTPDSDDESSPAASDADRSGTCPDYGDRVERVICFDAIDPAETDVFLEPSTGSIAIDGDDSIAFTLENGSDEPLATNFYNWRVDKFVDGTWFRVAPLAVPEPLMYLDPGETHTWTVTPDDEVDEEGDAGGHESATEDATLRPVGAGRYAFRARGWFEDESHDEAIAFAATFELEGDPLEVTPSGAIVETEWDDDVLVARSDRGDPDDDHYRLGGYELERVDDPGDDAESRRVIAEQVVGNDQLRDALALALERDADRVRLEEYDATHPIFGSRSDGVYRFRDEYWRVETRELEGES